MDHNLVSTPSNGHADAYWEWQDPFHTMSQMFCKIASDTCLQFQCHCQSVLSCLGSCRQGQRNANTAGGLLAGFPSVQTMKTPMSNFSIDLLWILLQMFRLTSNNLPHFGFRRVVRIFQDFKKNCHVLHTARLDHFHGLYSHQPYSCSSQPISAWEFLALLLDEAESDLGKEFFQNSLTSLSCFSFVFWLSLSSSNLKIFALSSCSASKPLCG